MSLKARLWHSLRRVKWYMDSALDKCGYRLERKGGDTPTFFYRLLKDRMRKSKEIVFIQIGANDGINADPLYPLISESPSQFRGLVVEPLKDKYEQLRQTYAGIHTVIPVNMAVHATEKEMTIYRVRPDRERRLPTWATGIGSFDPDHFKLSHLDESYIVAEKVACTTFDDLLNSYGITNVELLITDTEGYDLEILRSIDFERCRPVYIRFEHGLHSGMMSWEGYKSLVRDLARHGYHISHEDSDTTAFLPDAL